MLRVIFKHVRSTGTYRFDIAFVTLNMRIGTERSIYQYIQRIILRAIDTESIALAL